MFGAIDQIGCRGVQMDIAARFQKFLLIVDEGITKSVLPQRAFPVVA